MLIAPALTLSLSLSPSSTQLANNKSSHSSRNAHFSSIELYFRGKKERTEQNHQQNERKKTENDQTVEKEKRNGVHCHSAKVRARTPKHARICYVLMRSSLKKLTPFFALFTFYSHLAFRYTERERESHSNRMCVRMRFQQWKRLCSLKWQAKKVISRRSRRHHLN